MRAGVVPLPDVTPAWRETRAVGVVGASGEVRVVGAAGAVGAPLRTLRGQRNHPNVSATIVPTSASAPARSPAVAFEPMR